MSQNSKILKYLQENPKGISQKEAYEMFGILRLSGRIFDLKQKGWDIVTEYEDGENRYGEPTRYGRYRLLPQ